MLVSQYMTKNPIYIPPETPVSDARNLMRREKIGCLPVLDRDNKLIGIVTRRNLLKAGPTAATTLDMYEISYLLSKLKVDKIMEREVITVSDGEVLEEAARVMADNTVNCLPVMRDAILVGVITTKDIFRAFIDALGARHEGVRITVSMEERRGQLAHVAQAVTDRGGNIVAFVTHAGDNLTEKRGTLKITGLDKDAAEEALTAAGAKLIDIR
jgi:acetoin utilization protein AcuB